MPRINQKYYSHKRSKQRRNNKRSKQRRNNKRSKQRRNNKRRSNNKRSKQRGGKVVLPTEYFNPNFQGNYVSQEQLNEVRNENIAVSHGIAHGENMNSVGPDLHAGIGLNNQSGGGLPIEYFGGENGRYFEVGSPELESCTTPYGLNHPTSHGVVLDAPDGSQIDAQGLWMGPQLASGPGGTGQTGGAKKRKRKRRTKKRKN